MNPETPEATQPSQEEILLRKKIKSNRIKIIMDVTVIVIILGIGFYVWNNIEAFKALGSDVCRLCEQKTGGLCTMAVKVSS